jgi:hypothetical protein
MGDEKMKKTKVKEEQNLLDLRPTQFAVGMLEVDEKVKIVEQYDKKELKNWIKDNPVPVIVSPRGELYITDHHHFLCVCYHLGIRKVRVTVVDDFSKSKLTYEQFWKRMHRLRSVYPYCQFGEGPREPLYLPRDIRGLADDPYRSLAWFVRKAGVFENSDKNFAEFQWANFFRKQRLLSRVGPWGFARALVKAAKLAQSPKAKHLPGYGKLNLAQQKKAREKLKARVSEHINEKSR